MCGSTNSARVSGVEFALRFRSLPLLHFVVACPIRIQQCMCRRDLLAAFATGASCFVQTPTPNPYQAASLQMPHILYRLPINPLQVPPLRAPRVLYRHPAACVLSSVCQGQVLVLGPRRTSCFVRWWDVIVVSTHFFSLRRPCRCIFVPVDICVFRSQQWRIRLSTARTQ